MNPPDDRLTGFGGYFETEALANALPIGQNSPQKVPYGLYAEQLSGSAFTCPRSTNLRSWLYRIRPSVVHDPFTPIPMGQLVGGAPFSESPPTPNQLRWDPLPYPTAATDFVEGLNTYAGNGHPNHQWGAAVHGYAINRSMSDRFLYNADGEWLLIPEEGELSIYTEMGKLTIAPTEIAVIPRGIKFQVCLEGEKARGYVGENFGAPLRLPDLGPIGANGLANPRDFQYPKAHYESREGHYQLMVKYQGHLWACDIRHHPLDVVAWHGNYAPYQYDLKRFNTIGTVSFDHPDPSIFTVLTSPSDTAGVANMDFVIFPDRFMVAEHTFRPPYYHRNLMSEFMGLIKGQYDAKKVGFKPGGASLHNCMAPHGPDLHAFEQAIQEDLKPVHTKNTLAFMLETRSIWHPTDYAMNASFRQQDYQSCWRGLKKYFNR